MRARVIAALAGAILLAVPGAAQEKSRANILSIFGGVFDHFASGETGEYLLGENDFPVVPAHLGPLFGLSYLRLGKRVGWEIDARFIGSTPVELEDPSDGDILEVSAGPHASLALNVLYAPFPGGVRPYLLAGGGLDVYLSGDAAYTSRYGFVIDIPAPVFKDRLDPEAHVGLGLLIVVGKSWGCRLEGRFGWIFEGERTLAGLSGAGGFYLAF